MANPSQQFQQVIMPKTPISRQDLSHTFKFTTDIGPITPILCFETLPHDVAKVRSDVFLRFMPMVFPIMHEVDVYVHYFEVPWYLIMRKWPKFIIPQEGEGLESGQTPIPEPQWFDAADLVNDADLLSKGSLADYFGIPPVDSNGPAGSPFGNQAALTEDIRLQLAPFIAYQLIYDAYYRDQHLESEIDFDAIREIDGDIMDSDLGLPVLKQLLTLRYRAWEKDVFTSALPEPQFGTPQGILLDLSQLVGDVGLISAADAYRGLQEQNPINPQFVSNLYTTQVGPEWNQQVTQQPLKLLADQFGNHNAVFTDDGYGAANEGPLFYDPQGSLKTTFASDTPVSFTIEQLRFAYRQQAFKEMLNVGGSRDTEVIRSQFNIIPDDLTIGRPRYLGGGKQNVVISEVLQQSQSTESSVLGEFAGHGISVGSANGFKARFKYWGFVIGVMSIRPRSAYGQGVPKMFTKFDRNDYYWPHLSHLGEQEVSNGELFWSWNDGKNREEFGYQPIYHDYRYAPSRLAGEMRDTLQDWHMNRLFSSRPRLNADFVKIKPEDVNHIFAVPENGEDLPQHIVCEVFNSVQMVRPMPKFATPIL